MHARVRSTGDRARGKQASIRACYTARATGATARSAPQRRHARAYACVSESGATSPHGPPTRASPNTLSARKLRADYPETSKLGAHSRFVIIHGNSSFIIEDPAHYSRFVIEQ